MISGIVLLEIELDTSEKIATKILFLVLRNSYETDQKRGLHHNSSIRIWVFWQYKNGSHPIERHGSYICKSSRKLPKLQTYPQVIHRPRLNDRGARQPNSWQTPSETPMI